MQLYKCSRLTNPFIAELLRSHVQAAIVCKRMITVLALPDCMHSFSRSKFYNNTLV
jgi:hypothetical protein